MNKNFPKWMVVFLIVLLSFPPVALAGRKHEDVEDIGNRNINGK